MLKPEYNLSGEVGGLAHSFNELMGKLYGWRTDKQRGLSRNAADGACLLVCLRACICARASLSSSACAHTQEP